jgi:DNA polymerase elongation subunit (family B)
VKTNYYYYDDIKSNILNTNNLQEYFDFLIRNSDNEVIEFINNRLESNKLLLINNLITNNETNPFETTIVELKPPIKYPIKVQDYKLTIKFENFKN